VEKNETHLHCPGDPTGRECFTDSDGVDGVSEATLFSKTMDDTGNKLTSRGVNVDTWPVLGGDRHGWNRAAEDHPPKDGSKEVKWDDMDDPQVFI
jgi:hypothetical protein